jgi:hypothetical protein
VNRSSAIHWTAFGLDGQGVVVDADVDRTRVDAGQIGVQHVVIARPVEVHRHERRGATGGHREVRQTSGQPVHVTERIETKHSHHLLESERPTSVVGAIAAVHPPLLALSCAEC